jgi:hypothetical protein
MTFDKYQVYTLHSLLKFYDANGWNPALALEFLVRKFLGEL